MPDIKVIRTERDYQEALEFIEALMAGDPDPESQEGEQLSILSTLVADYEAKAFSATLPDPVEAIKFRMEQADLTPADLIPYLGSRSRVSEILSGKRTLTLDMIRLLEAGLGIPAKVLLKKPDQSENALYSGWDTRVIREMSERGYFGRGRLDVSNKEKLLRNFFSVIGPEFQLAGMPRQSHYRSSLLTDKRALAAWSEYILKKSEEVKVPVKYKNGAVNLAFMREMAKLSTKEKSPIVAQQYLTKFGIKLVIAPHLTKTYLDGATILINKDNPVIGLTVRYDRLDNFWFTLMHELAHIALHFDKNINLFYDEIEGVGGAEIDTKETEADMLAGEALLPNDKWEKSPAKRVPSPVAAQSLADELGINVAIVTGIMMHKHKRYQSPNLNAITNAAKVRDYFQDIKWPTK